MVKILMNVNHYTELNSLPHDIQSTVFSLIQDCDNDFSPPLSTRSSTCQKFITPPTEESTEGSLVAFYNALAQQPCFVAFDDNEKALGLLSYKQSHVLPFTHEWDDPVYVTTVCTSPLARGQGVAKALYTALDEQHKDTVCCLRTWSTNEPQLGLLDKLGWESVMYYPNDRGQGVGTVYLAKNHKQ